MSATATARTVFAILAIAFFATPIAARVVGVTAESFENRPFAGAPRLSQGWDAFGQTTRFLTDRMPLRAQAVRANTRIWTDVFGATPRYAGQVTIAGDAALPFAGAVEQPDQSEQPGGPDGAAAAAQVISGGDGWLYLQAEQDRACAPAVATDVAVARWARLVATVRAHGRRAIAVVAPDKASVYPEHLPADFPNADCAERGKRELWSLLERSAPSTGVLPLRAALLREKGQGGDLLYMRKDSHWNDAGSLSLVRESLAALGRGVGVEPKEVVDAGEGPYTGDLTALLGAPEDDVRPLRQLAREPNAPRVPGRALLVKDSYGEAPTAQLAPYFEDLRTILWVGTPPERIAREVALADTIVFETVEREFAARAARNGAVGAVTQALRRLFAGR